MNRDFITNAKGQTPAVALVDPKYPENIAKVLRNCSVFGVMQLWVTGNRAISEVSNLKRLPREERMRSYGDVDICLGEYFFDAFPSGVTPVAVELSPSAQTLTEFKHPPNPLYVFGPEDGGLRKVHRKLCHRFIVIPTRQGRCLNLAVATGIVLAHRYMQQIELGLEKPYDGPLEPGDHRGFITEDETFIWE